MNLFSGLAAAGRAVSGALGSVAKESVETAKREFGQSLRQPFIRSAAEVKKSVSEGVTGARAAAADAIARGAAGAGIKVAERVAPEGHWTQRVSGFLDLDPKTRTVVLWVVVVIAAALIFYAGRKS